MFGASLEQDIGETINSTQGDLGDVPTPLVNGRQENESNKEMSTVGGHRSIPNDRWSLIDDILQVYKDHTHDMKLVNIQQRCTTECFINNKLTQQIHVHVHFSVLCVFSVKMFYNVSSCRNPC